MKFKLLQVILILIYCTAISLGVSAAASDGKVSAASTGTSEISLTIPEVVKLKNLNVKKGDFQIISNNDSKLFTLNFLTISKLKNTDKEFKALPISKLLNMEGVKNLIVLIEPE